MTSIVAGPRGPPVLTAQHARMESGTALHLHADRGVRQSLGVLLERRAVHHLPDGDTAVRPSCDKCAGNPAATPPIDRHMGGWPASDAGQGNNALLQ